jgi:hypothetical protein
MTFDAEAMAREMCIHDEECAIHVDRKCNCSRFEINVAVSEPWLQEAYEAGRDKVIEIHARWYAMLGEALGSANDGRDLGERIGAACQLVAFHKRHGGCETCNHTGTVRNGMIEQPCDCLASLR